MRVTIALFLTALAASSQAQDAAPTVWLSCGSDIYDSFKSHHGALTLAAPDSHKLPRVSLPSTEGVGCVLFAPGLVSDGYGYSLFVARSTGRAYLIRFGGLDGSWTYFGPAAVELSDLTMRSISGRAANDAARQ
jgi:hypothetical protein